MIYAKYYKPAQLCVQLAYIYCYTCLLPVHKLPPQSQGPRNVNSEYFKTLYVTLHFINIYKCYLTTDAIKRNLYQNFNTFDKSNATYIHKIPI